MTAENTGTKLPAHLRDDLKFKSGAEWRGNAAGRPKGSRNKLAEAFVSDLLSDWEDNGTQAIKDMREKSPTDYCKVVAAVIPKEVVHTVEEYDNLSDDELAREFADVAARLSARNASGGRDRAAGEPKALPH